MHDVKKDVRELKLEQIGKAEILTSEKEAEKERGKGEVQTRSNGSNGTSNHTPALQKQGGKQGKRASSTGSKG